MDPDISNSPRNQALVDLYCRNWPTLRDIMKQFPGLSSPYFAWTHPDYERAAIRLVVVGKETNGWGQPDQIIDLDPLQAVERQMQEYRKFKLGVNYSGKQSFWVPVHELYARLNPGGEKLGFVALNVSKMDQNQGVPNWEVRDALTTTGLLHAEIMILEPDVVVFHSGPRYESWIDLWFPGLKRSGDMWLSTLEVKGLPKHSFRTYHPQYLNRKSRRKQVYDAIVSKVNSDRSAVET